MALLVRKLVGIFILSKSVFSYFKTKKKKIILLVEKDSRVLHQTFPVEEVVGRDQEEPRHWPENVFCFVSLIVICFFIFLYVDKERQIEK